MSSVRRQYPFHLIEPKWQRRWEDQETFRAWNPGEPIPAGHPFAVRHGLSGPVASASLPPKCYILDMFPYPSGAGLHVGHPEGYTATDILARYKRARGFHVLHPMGWDAFGLPAEQYAIKTGQHPEETTQRNIANFRRQIKALGFSYDWSREIDTTHPSYFKWTQWIFLRMYHSWYNPATQKAEPIETLPIPEVLREGADRRDYIDSRRLAYVAEAPVNWCPELGTVLANEEVVNGKSEVGGFSVIRRPMRQWMLRITAYAERLLADLEGLDWSPALKEMQRNWIGRSEGAEVSFRVADSEERIVVFTTRPDTLFGATYMVLAPEHPLVDRIAASSQASAVLEYRRRAAAKSDRERTDLAKEKSGVFTGAYAVNPVDRAEIPIWIADYVLVSYGTGAIMAVPAHDTRDLAFAQRFNLPIKKVVQAPEGQKSIGFTGDGTSVNSGFLNDLSTAQAKKKVIEWLVEHGCGRQTIHYKLRDWLFSRQRYWGEPFPVVWRDGRHQAIPEDQLPLVPPALHDFKPTPSGDPPLARAGDWTHLPGGWQRETNTMPQWAGSCWYYLRFVDPRNEKELVNHVAEDYWMRGGRGAGVDLYVGGTEHAVLHLLYARFWHKFLFDSGCVSTPEPFQKLVNQGLILGQDGQKMSKSRGNVINPDTILSEYGADAFRLYEMFMGPLDMVKPWNTKGVEGVNRFLGRVWRLFVGTQSKKEFAQACTLMEPGDETLLDLIRLDDSIVDIAPSREQLKSLHACIKKVADDLENLRFNTAISALMVFVNKASGWRQKPESCLRVFLQLLHPFAPHIAEELFSKLSGSVGDCLAYAAWPGFDSALLREDQLEIPVQVNGKLRDKLIVDAEASREAIQKAALASVRVRPFLEGKTVKKLVVVPKKLINLVVE